MSKKRKHKKHFKPYNHTEQNLAVESDYYFGFIMGYTSGGAAYGLTHEEYNAILNDEKNKSTKT